MEGFTPQRIRQNRGPTLEFDGRLISDMSTHQAGKMSWNENALWETPGGKWILEIRKCSDREGQQDFATAVVFDQDHDLERKIAVMDALEWVFPAQHWAKRMGWNLVKRID